MAKKAMLVAALVAAMLVPGAHARAEHVLAHAASASNCLPAGLVCARVDLELRYDFILNAGVYTLRTSALATALLAPGTLDARISVFSPPGVPEHSDADGCGWSVGGSGCAVSLNEHVFIVPEGFGSCTDPLTFDLSGTARAIDDPVLRLVPVNARVTQLLRLCADGTVEVV